MTKTTAHLFKAHIAAWEIVLRIGSGQLVRQHPTRPPDPNVGGVKDDALISKIIREGRQWGDGHQQGEESDSPCRMEDDMADAARECVSADGFGN